MKPGTTATRPPHAGWPDAIDVARLYAGIAITVGGAGVLLAELARFLA